MINHILKINKKKYLCVSSVNIPGKMKQTMLCCIVSVLRILTSLCRWTVVLENKCNHCYSRMQWNKCRFPDWSKYVLYSQFPS